MFLVTTVLVAAVLLRLVVMHSVLEVLELLPQSQALQ
jgi:hypothetical protein